MSEVKKRGGKCPTHGETYQMRADRGDGKPGLVCPACERVTADFQRDVRKAFAKNGWGGE